VLGPAAIQVSTPTIARSAPRSPRPPFSTPSRRTPASASRKPILDSLPPSEKPRRA